MKILHINTSNRLSYPKPTAFVLFMCTMWRTHVHLSTHDPCLSVHVNPPGLQSGGVFNWGSKVSEVRWNTIIRPGPGASLFPLSSPLAEETLDISLSDRSRKGVEKWYPTIPCCSIMATWPHPELLTWNPWTQIYPLEMSRESSWRPSIGQLSSSVCTCCFTKSLYHCEIHWYELSFI